MEKVINFLCDYVLLFAIVYIVYAVFLNKKRKVYSKLKKNDIMRIFIARYDIDVRKVDYKKMLNTITVIVSLIISFTATIVLYMDNFFLSILVCFVILFVLIYSLFEIAGRHFKKMEEKKDV